MKVTPTSFTVAEYCEQMRQHQIVINREYQRSSRVWPPAARSYLIDTVINGFPIPKLSLYQKTDLKTRKTLKEIVDGQQRSQAILDFLDDKLRLSSNSSFRGLVFSQLSEEKQQQFVEYPLSVDLFVAATDLEIREQFRRINSYNVPLNPQEKRHAVWQGTFKWFIVEETAKYAQTLKDLGVFNESQLARMEDSKLLSDICLSFLNGIESASETKLDKLYRDKDIQFPESTEFAGRLADIFNTILNWEAIHGGQLMRKYNFYTLALAITHWRRPIPTLQPIFEVVNLQAEFVADIVLANLTALSSAQEGRTLDGQFHEFVVATSKTTDRKGPREERFRWFCRALQPQPLA
jgi:hypothetical protein